MLSLLSLVNAVSGQEQQPWAGTYLYDGAGNIKAIGQNHYAYDGVSRLRQGTAVTPAQHDVQQYAYDAFGNLTSTTTGGDTAHPLTTAVNPATNRADLAGGCPSGSSCFIGEYDEGGNQVSYGSTAYSYDSDSMLAGLDAPNRNQLYIYDAGGQRVAVIDHPGTSSQTSRYTLRDLDSSVVREVVQNGSAVTWTRDYVKFGGGNLLASIAPEQTRHFHLDHLGTPRLITTDGGRRISVHTYWPFGREAAGSDADDEPIKFTGHERDSNGDGNDLDYMHARYYGSSPSRFLSVDPGPQDLRRPQSWNRYSYADNDPIRRVDRDGRLSNPVTAEVGRGQPIVHRGGGLGQIRKEQPHVRGSAAGEYGADRAGGRKHKGIDIVAPVGTPVVGAFSGEVSEVRKNDSKLGLSVFVSGKNGIIAIYSHLSATDLKKGDTVKEGQTVGNAGRSGNVEKSQPASEDHVHFQLYDENGKVTNPETFLNDPKKQETYRDPEKDDKKPPK